MTCFDSISNLNASLVYSYRSKVFAFDNYVELQCMQCTVEDKEMYTSESNKHIPFSKQLVACGYVFYVFSERHSLKI